MKKLAILLTVMIARLAAGQELEGRFYPDKGSYATGEPLIFWMEIKNVGKQPAYLFAKPPGQCSDVFTFSAQEITPKASGFACGTTWDTQCSDDLYLLKPVEAYTVNWPLDFWYRIEHAGKYKVSIARHTWFSAGGMGAKELQFSSEFEFSVVPSDPAYVQSVLQKFEADMRSKDPSVQHDALDVLASTAPAYFQNEILRLAHDPDGFKVEHAVGGLRRLNTPQSSAALADIITTRHLSNDDEITLRCNAIQALGDSGDASYITMLGPYAEHVDTCESEAAMQAIATLGKKTAVRQLQSFLQNPQAKLRENAASALRLTVSPDAVDALIPVLRDKDEAVRLRASTSLVELTAHSVQKPDQPPPSPLQMENLWRVWWQANRQSIKLVEPGPEFCRM